MRLQIKTWDQESYALPTEPTRAQIYLQFDKAHHFASKHTTRLNLNSHHFIDMTTQLLITTSAAISLCNAFITNLPPRPSLYMQSFPQSFVQNATSMKSFRFLQLYIHSASLLLRPSAGSRPSVPTRHWHEHSCLLCGYKHLKKMYTSHLYLSPTTAQQSDFQLWDTQCFCIFEGINKMNIIMTGKTGCTWKPMVS